MIVLLPGPLTAGTGLGLFWFEIDWTFVRIVGLGWEGLAVGTIVWGLEVGLGAGLDVGLGAGLAVGRGGVCTGLGVVRTGVWGLWGCWIVWVREDCWLILRGCDCWIVFCWGCCCWPENVNKQLISRKKNKKIIIINFLKKLPPNPFNLVTPFRMMSNCWEVNPPRRGCCEN